MTIFGYVVATVAFISVLAFFFWAVCSEAERTLGRELTLLEALIGAIAGPFVVLIVWALPEPEAKKNPGD